MGVMRCACIEVSLYICVIGCDTYKPVSLSTTKAEK